MITSVNLHVYDIAYEGRKITLTRQPGRSANDSLTRFVFVYRY